MSTNPQEEGIYRSQNCRPRRRPLRAGCPRCHVVGAIAATIAATIATESRMYGVVYRLRVQAVYAWVCDSSLTQEPSGRPGR